MGRTVIATWRMSLEGVRHALQQENRLADAVVEAVCHVEDNPLFSSVGYGGLPNEAGEVELDAAFMDGATLQFGAVMAAVHLKNPVRAAQQLSAYPRNSVLAGEGVLKCAVAQQWPLRDNRYWRATARWQAEIRQPPDAQCRDAYDGHDTVCVLGAEQGHVVAAVSTSGLFMKKSGRVGDSPLIGSGCYADDAAGVAAATGVGEDIMKGCLSYEIVRLMERLTPQQACEQAIRQHTDKLMRLRGSVGSMSVVALNPRGEWGAATNKEEFSFVTGEAGQTVVWLAHCRQGVFSTEPAPAAWLQRYDAALPGGAAC